MLSWLVTEKVRHGHPTSLGAASGAVAGLVAITPAWCQRQPCRRGGPSVWLPGLASAMFVELKYKFGLDDSLDVVGVHRSAGWSEPWPWASSPCPVNGEGGGLFYGGGFQQLVAQTVAVVVTVLLSGVITAVIGRGIHRTVGLPCQPLRPKSRA